MAESLYRKYRPQIFEDVVGQEPIERTLKNAIAANKVSHAYLFTGPRGTGKTTTARLVAKALLCQNGPTPDPDGTCEDCQMIAEGTHPDVYELDAASRTGVENVREEIISRVQFAPTRGRYKVYIIDEVHMLSTAAFNALLKTLEEPPEHVVFILCTTDPQKVPETIHSRCQRFDFRRISPESMVSRLGAVCVSENVEFEGEALDLIAHRAEGGMRNALTSLEQIIAFDNGKVTLAGAERILGSIDSNDMAQIIAAVGKRDVAAAFRWTADYVETGADLAQFTRDMAEHVRNMYILEIAGNDAELEITETMRRELVDEMKWFGKDRLARLMGIIGDLMAELKTSSNARLSFEIALTRMVRPDTDLTLESLAERVEALESGYSAVAHVVEEPAFAAREIEVPTSAPAPEMQQRHHASERPAANPEKSPRGASTDAPALRVAERKPEPQFVERKPALQPRETPAPAQKHVPVQEQTSVREQAPAQGGQVSGELLSSLQNPAALQRIWQATMASLKKQKTAYGVLFMGAKAVFDASSGGIAVEFPAENGFAFKAVQKPEAVSALEAALHQAAGAAVPFTYTQRGAASAPAAGQVPSRATAQPDAGLSAPTVMQGNREPSPQPEPRPAQAEPFREGAVNAAPVPPAPYDEAPSSEPSFAPEYEAVPYDDVYEAVPYEDEPYDEVPYEEAPYDEPYGETPRNDEAAGSSTPDAADPSQDDVASLLQQGFGDGVVFTEVDE